MSHEPGGSGPRVGSGSAFHSTTTAELAPSPQVQHWVLGISPTGGVGVAWNIIAPWRKPPHECTIYHFAVHIFGHTIIFCSAAADVFAYIVEATQGVPYRVHPPTGLQRHSKLIYTSSGRLPTQLTFENQPLRGGLPTFHPRQHIYQKPGFTYNRSRAVYLNKCLCIH